jgi:DNA-binding LytR/AlgR family response regulator
MIKIGIVEDEVLISELIKISLEKSGYEAIEPVTNYTEAIKMIETYKPDFLIIDVQLSGSKDGIDLASYVNENHKLPFIFLTANSDKATIERAKQVNPFAYLVKPFKSEELFTTIEICLNNYNSRKPELKTNVRATAKDSIFVKDSTVFHKILCKDILYLESDHVYVNLHTINKRYLIRSSMKDLYENLDPNIFLKIHKSYIINSDHVQTIDPNFVEINKVKLPISKNYKNELFLKLGLNN